MFGGPKNPSEQQRYEKSRTRSDWALSGVLCTRTSFLNQLVYFMCQIAKPLLGAISICGGSAVAWAAARPRFRPPLKKRLMAGPLPSATRTCERGRETLKSKSRRAAKL